MLKDRNGTPIGKLLFGGRVVGTDGNEFGKSLVVSNARGISIGMISSGKLFTPDGKSQMAWLPMIESCDSIKIRLVHLDGTALAATDYDRIHRFVRLWRKLGWSMQELDWP